MNEETEKKTFDPKVWPEIAAHLKHINKKNKESKYVRLVKGLCVKSIPCKSAKELFLQWHYYMDIFRDEGFSCECQTRIKHVIIVRNKKTHEQTMIGNICVRRFEDAEMLAAYEDAKYKNIHGKERKKCAHCLSVMRANSRKRYCEDCDKFSSSFMRFGKYKGEKLREIPLNYLKWLNDQKWFRDYGGHVENFLERLPQSSGH